MSDENDRPPVRITTDQADFSPIALLESIKGEDKTWDKLAPRYGVTHPDPPWKVSLYALCECLSAGGALSSLERRYAEDRLGETLYSGTPAPEQQLLALAHIMLSRGLLAQEDLATRMRAVRSRLESS
ncbi:MAG TPA: hypothetical protein VE621_11745 [Bryobacteraceae bacterium]|nr:hypothetical protein [Bryobacteraceae bacterium]